MKKLFFAFPSLKKKRFFLFLAFLLIFTLLSGFLYTPEKVSAPLSFEEEKVAIEQALAETEKNLESCPKEDENRLLQEKIYYESALKFGISPWSSEFAYEALSLYAALSLECGTEETREKLATILTERDAEALYEFCKSDPSLPELDLLQISTDSAPSPGKSALLYDLARLEESLATGKDCYFTSQKSLTEKDIPLFQKLLQVKKDALLKGTYNPVPLNEETLVSLERITSCIAVILLLGVAGTASKDGKNHLFFFSLVILATVLFCSVSLLVTTLIFAPGTMQPLLLASGGSLPFFPALFLRFFCRVMGSAPLMLLCLFLRLKKEKKGTWKILAFLPPLRFLLSGKPVLTSVFSLGDLAWCIFPEMTALSTRPFAPLLGIFLWLFALAAGLAALTKKEQKITPEKQKLSLENQSEL